MIGHHLRLHGQASAGTTVLLGIPKDIMLCNADHPPGPDDNLPSGTAQMFDMAMNPTAQQ